ncbi:hypothetical protein H0W26_04300 [Candidatus Dependentiae bacterium]|nr:hypothetical protein [Candidatus Dependentiae bacterium]
MKRLVYVFAVCMGFSAIASMETTDFFQDPGGSTNNFIALNVDSSVAQCPICLEGFEDNSESCEENSFVYMECCKKPYHKGCINKWESARKTATCPSCRSANKKLSIIDISVEKCFLCNQKFTDKESRESIVSLHCTLPVKTLEVLSHWWQAGAHILSLPNIAAHAFFSTSDAVTHHFHDNCLSNYYSTEKTGHNDNFGEITYYCPIHKESEVTFPKTGALSTMQLADKTHMTEEEVLALTQKLDAIDKARYQRNLQIKINGGIPSNK